jgi:gliding motility-associated-like protein
MWKKNFSLFITLILLQLTVAAQAICKDSLPLSLLLNPSFEDHGACNPYWRGEGGIINGSSTAVNIDVPFWHPENTIQYIRYYNYDCRRSFGSIFGTDFSILDTGFPGIPDSLPHGKGLVSIEQNNVGYNGYLPENKTDKKYITACLTSPLQAGKTYGFAFDLGFGKFNPNYNDVTGFWASASPFSIGIFGRTDCPAFPINRPIDSSAGCLADRSGWFPLGKITLRGKSQWVPGYIEFTAPAGISSIGIGPSCEYNENIKDTFALYYLDNIVLSEKQNFAFASITALSGNTCTGHYVLQAPAYDNATYQWFKDEQLITGAVDQTYTVPDIAGAQGNYFVNISLSGDCFVSLPFVVKLSPVHDLALGDNILVCDSLSVKLDATLPGIDNYLWQDGSTDSVFTAKAAGVYSVTASDNTGCSKTASVNISFTHCSSCKLFFPSAFTPDQNGLNDIFRPRPSCSEIPLLKYHFIIYNRWGQPVFNSSDPSQGWDGRYHNVSAPQGVYVYLAEYSLFPGKSIRTTGTVMLVR